MAVPAANVTGNYGLLDQQMALKWIRRHITAFGGDPHRITLMGWSAGAASVGLHMVAKSSAGLFQRAIMMSGAAINPWAFSMATYNCSDALLRQWNIHEEDESGLKSLLQQMDAHSFVQNGVMDTWFRVFGYREFCFVPTIEDRLTPVTPEHLLAELSTTDQSVPLLIGSTSVEMGYDFPLGFLWENANLPNSDPTVVENLDEYLRGQLKAMFPVDERREEQRLQFLNNLRAIADIHYGVWKFAGDYVQRTGRPVFVYRFSFDGKFGGYKECKECTGAVHGDDLGYLFGDMRQRDEMRGAKDEKVVRRRMVQMWTSFIKSG